MDQIPVIGLDGAPQSPTSPERAAQIAAKGKGDLQQDTEGRVWLQLRYTPQPTEVPPRRGGKQAKWRRKTIAAIRRRDGDDCFYCLERLSREEMTLEHLLSKSLKGSDSTKNLVIAHKDCNDKAGNLSIAEKVRLRERQLLKKIQEGAPYAVDL